MPNQGENENQKRGKPTVNGRRKEAGNEQAGRKVASSLGPLHKASDYIPLQAWQSNN